MKETRFLIVDGNSIGFRAASAKPPFQEELINSKGVITGGTYRFINILNKTLEMIKPTHVIIGFDTGGYTFRNDIDPEYKANRTHGADKQAIYNQFGDMKKVLDAIGIKHDNILCYEGDDIVGTYCKISKATKNFILSGDKDIFQLINDNTEVIFPIKGVSEVGIYNKDSFKERFGIDVEQYIDFKSIIGDKGDNIKGIDGLGDKTAMKLLNKFGNIETIMDNLNKTHSDIRGWKGIVNKLNNWNYSIPRQLVTINTDSPIKYTFEDCEIDLNWKNAIEVFEELEFNTFISKVNNGKFYGCKK